MNIKYEKPKFSSVLGPLIKIGIGTPISIKTQLEQYQSLLDTGYDGSLLISQKIVDSTGLFAFRLPNSNKVTAEFITGQKIKMYSVEALIYLPKIDIEFIITADVIPECNEFLIGRQLLEELYVHLKGPERQFSIRLN